MKESENIALQNLKCFTKILDECNIPFFLDGGTLLGAYRDGSFCLDDENDIDIGSWANFQHKLPLVIEKALDRGFEIWRYWNGDPRTPGKAQELSVYRYKAFIEGLGREMPMKIDLYFYEYAGDESWACVYEKEKCIPRVIPSEHIVPRKMSTIDFHGIKCSIPANVEKYLEYCYGDWQTPKHRSKYSCYNPDDLKVLRPDYKFYEV